MLSRCLYGAQISVIIALYRRHAGDHHFDRNRYHHRLSRRQDRSVHAALRRRLDELSRSHHPAGGGVRARPRPAADHRHARPAARHRRLAHHPLRGGLGARDMYVHAAQSIGASTSASCGGISCPTSCRRSSCCSPHASVPSFSPIQPVVFRPRRAAADPDLGRHAVGPPAAPSCSRDPGWRWRRACVSPSSSTPPTYSETRLRVCSIRACAASSEFEPRSEIEGASHDHYPHYNAPCGRVVRFSSRATPASAQTTRSRNMAAASMSAPSMSRCRHCRSIPPTGTGNSTTTPATILEQLFAADLRSRKKIGGKHPFYADAYLPSDAIRGELAESWEWKKDPLRVEVRLRKGIMFPEKPGVMQSRELTAEDVVFATTGSPRARRRRPAISPMSTRSKPPTAIPSSSTSTPYHAEWDYRFGWGYYSPIYPEGNGRCWRHQLEERQRHRAVHADDFVQGNSNTYSKNPIYWDKEKIGGTSTKLPFVDKVVYRTIKDEATFSPRCVPASSTFSRASAGRRSAS